MQIIGTVRSQVHKAFERIHNLSMTFENLVFKISRKAIMKEMSSLSDNFPPYKFKLQYGTKGAEVTITPGISFDGYFKTVVNESDVELLLRLSCTSTPNIAILNRLNTVLTFANSLHSKYNIACI